MSHRDDIVVVGGGPVGATLALALRGSGLSVRVLEARPQGAADHDPRALALSQGSRQILQRLGVWQELARCATPIETIHVSQRGSLGRTILHAEELRQEALGYVLPYGALSGSLKRALDGAHEARVVYAAQATAVVPAEDDAEVRFKCDGVRSTATARLAVLADGGRSLGGIPGLKREVKEYGHSAVVGRVECEVPHGNIAYERFTPDGPVALLPDGARAFALVWTTQPETAALLCGMDERDFLERLHGHFGDRVGRFVAVSGRAAFPLKLSRVRPVTAPHLAVIGNAAQTLHPVAGQGFNLGLRDAWELALTIRDAGKEQLGAPQMLARYRQRRRLDTGGGMFFTDFLVRSFSNDILGLGALRGAGLALTDLVPPLKGFVARRMSFGAHG